MNEQELKNRTRSFALRAMKLVDALPKDAKGRALAGQIIRSGTSVAANYRAACRAKSQADFTFKLAIVEEEADETALWIELITEGGLLPAPKTRELLAEANEIVAIMVASRKTIAHTAQESKIKNQKSKIP
jgi:four helix bundle protein